MDHQRPTLIDRPFNQPTKTVGFGCEETWGDTLVISKKNKTKKQPTREYIYLSTYQQIHMYA